MKLLNDFLVKDGILAANGFGHDSLKIFFVNLFSGWHFTESLILMLIKIIFLALSNKILPISSTLGTIKILNSVK